MKELERLRQRELKKEAKILADKEKDREYEEALEMAKREQRLKNHRFEEQRMQPSSETQQACAAVPKSTILDDGQSQDPAVVHKVSPKAMARSPSLDGTEDDEFAAIWGSQMRQQGQFQHDNLIPEDFHEDDLFWSNGGHGENHHTLVEDANQMSFPAHGDDSGLFWGTQAEGPVLLSDATWSGGVFSASNGFNNSGLRAGGASWDGMPVGNAWGSAAMEGQTFPDLMGLAPPQVPYMQHGWHFSQVSNSVSASTEVDSGTVRAENSYSNDANGLLCGAIPELQGSSHDCETTETHVAQPNSAGCKMQKLDNLEALVENLRT